jgi:VCBS repeat-containing protein
VTPPATGTLSLNANGSFTYAPAPNFAGVVTFTYAAVDNGNPPAQSAPATVTITVNGVNDAPTAVPNSYTTSEDIVLTVAAANSVLANDTDPEAGTLTAQLVTTVPAATGTLALSPNGTFTYTPSPNFSGAATFTYRAVDNGTPPAQSAPATVTITVTPVNDPPTANNDTYSVAEDATLTVNAASGVLANDSDPDTGGALTAQLVATTPNGTLALNPTGSFTYSPRANFSGTDTFTYRVVDSGVPPAQSGVATVTITVAAANDAPVAAPDSYSMQEDAATPLTVAVRRAAR